MTLEQLLQSLAIRSLDSRWGIGTASQYLRSVEPCLSGGGLCPVSVFNLASSEAWSKELSDAAQRLTYCDAAMADFDLTKSINEGTGIASGSVLEYDCVLSSRRKDRDGDILESKGLEIDLKMPLLWQHIQVQPIGKHVSLLSQSDDLVSCKFAIADIPLGRDAATLVKFGALRKSHGFKPFEFTPVEIIKGADGKDHVRGWHVKRASVMEGSLVSIPANTDGNVTAVYEKSYAGQLDGIRTAYGRNLLATPFVKSWAKSISDSRPAASPGVTLAAKSDSTGRYQFNTLAERWFDTQTKQFVSAAEVGLTIKAAGPASPAPQAETPDKNGKCDECNVGEYDSTGSCPNCGHMRGTASKPGGKSTTPPETKSGRVLSAANKARLKSAVAEIEAVLEAASEPEYEGDPSMKPNAAAAGAVLTKAIGDSLETKMPSEPYLDGSYEQISYSLRRTAKDYLRSQNIDVPDGYCDMVGTFPGKAIVGIYGYGSSKDTCYQIDYAVDGTSAKWSGTPKSVEIKPQIIEKRRSELVAKSAGVSQFPQESAATPEQLARQLASKAVMGDADARKALSIAVSAAESIRLNDQLLSI